MAKDGGITEFPNHDSNMTEHASGRLKMVVICTRNKRMCCFTPAQWLT